MRKQENIREAPLGMNFDIMQSSLLTEARFGMTRTELQILVVLVAAAQEDMKTMIASGIREGTSLSRLPELDGDVLVRFSLNDFPVDMDGNEQRLVTAARSLVHRTIETHTEDGWVVEPLISKVEYTRQNRTILLTVRPSIWRMILDIRLGYTEYELFTALSLKSLYSVRFYMMASSDTKPREYSIAELKRQFCLEKKYAQVSDLFKNVIYPAKEELDEKAPVSFDVTPKKKEGSKEVVGIIFSPKRNRSLRDASLEEKKLLHGQIQVGMSLDKGEVKWLKEKMNFSPSELNANFGTFNTAKKVYGDGLMDAMNGIYESILRKNISNRKGYFVSSLRNNVKDLGKEVDVQGELFPNES